jgi:hypothetical protein
VGQVLLSVLGQGNLVENSDNVLCKEYKLNKIGALTFSFIQVVGKTDLGKLSWLISGLHKALNSLHLEAVGLDANDIAGVEGLSVELLEVGGLEDDTDGLVEVLFLLNTVAEGIGYGARFCNADCVAEFARLAVRGKQGVRFRLLLTGLVCMRLGG